jgi:GMP synthase (glutamine-hydrolysing)
MAGGGVGGYHRLVRKLLVFQHSASEPLGVLDPMLRERGFRVRYVNFGRDPKARPEVGRYNGLVVLGGTMNVDQTAAYPHLLTEIEAIREAVSRGIPVLGICLGAQLLAAALGATVRPNPVREIGWYRLQPSAEAASDPLCRHLDGGQHVFQWHAYTFDLPPGAVHLASTETCRNQAFRYRERAYGLQFHLEADEALIRRWLNVPAYRAEIEERGLEKILVDTRGYIASARAASERAFRDFIDLFDWRPKLRPQLGSR